MTSISRGDVACTPLERIQKEVLRVRAERLHLERESKMLQMALEELREEDAATDASEKDILCEIDSAEQELIRCFIRYALQESSGHPLQRDSASPLEVHGDSRSSETADVSTAMGEQLCKLLHEYKGTQDAWTHGVEEDLSALREEIRQAHRERRARSSDVAGAEARSNLSVAAMASEVDLVLEVAAEVNQEIDATLLEYGAALFLC
ncbi:hypothetical protein ABL78_5062 [Leptomonas seymouri]|uniref:Uncharacterized protein n=1 Tax=Leptomonas seymouri TaxID=5684 RepID=A0A0N1HVP8_LEPSE|nr:hypothetical protein ABL78_5062 [Leptomonas seymouri]|eukprot:KPI85881.1 hypothetical protein ABL78_5062 [Leptomonas seymouri]